MYELLHITIQKLYENYVFLSEVHEEYIILPGINMQREEEKVKVVNDKFKQIIRTFIEV